MSTRKRGRPVKYTNDQARISAIKDSKTKYMLSKPWKCEICQYESNLASKWMHLRTKKHITNTILEVTQANDRFELITDDK